MTVSKGNRFGLTRWSEDSDEWSREDWDEDNRLVELLGAIDLQVPNRFAMPAAGTPGRYVWVESDSDLPLDYGVDGYGSSLWRDNGAAWVRIHPARNVPERASIQFGPDAQNNPVNVPAVGWYPAGREMIYAYASGSQRYADGSIGEELVGGQIPPGTDWRDYAPRWISDLDTDPASPTAGRITIDRVGVYDVTVRIPMGEVAAGDQIWAAGLGWDTFGGVDGSGPLWVGQPFKYDAETRNLVGANGQLPCLTVRDSRVIHDNPQYTLELLPFLYFGTTATTSQRQYSAVYVDIVRWPGKVG